MKVEFKRKESTRVNRDASHQDRSNPTGLTEQEKTVVRMLEEDQQERIPVDRPPTVIEVDTNDEFLGPHPPGSIIHIFALRSTGLVENLRERYVRGNTSEVSASTLRQLSEPAVSHMQESVEDNLVLTQSAPELNQENAISDVLNQIPAYFDVKYRDRDLIRFISVNPQQGVGHYCIPSNGGPLSDGDFTIVEYRKTDEEPLDEIEHIIIKRPMILSPLEREIEAVDLDSGAIYASSVMTPMAFTPGAATILLATLATYTLSTWTIHLTGSNVLPGEDPSIDVANRVRELGHAPSYRDLVKLHQEHQLI